MGLLLLMLSVLSLLLLLLMLLLVWLFVIFVVAVALLIIVAPELFCAVAVWPLLLLSQWLCGVSRKRSVAGALRRVLKRAPKMMSHSWSGIDVKWRIIQAVPDKK